MGKIDEKRKVVFGMLGAFADQLNEENVIQLAQVYIKPIAKDVPESERALLLWFMRHAIGLQMEALAAESVLNDALDRVAQLEAKARGVN